jgi:acetyltransferase
LRPFAKLKGKPLLASWIGGIGVRPGAEILNRASIPTFEYPDAAARAFCAMWRYSHNLDALYETPELTATPEIDRSHAEQIINRERKLSSLHKRSAV